MQLIVTPSTVSATPLSSPHTARFVRMPTSGGDAIHCPLALHANADVVASLVNVHVRPGYNFPNADAAIGYGNSICDRVAAKMSYAQLVEQVKADFNTADYYQGAYLINQAVNELCPAQIWQ